MMYKLTFLLPIVALLLCCKAKAPTDPEEKICDASFKMLIFSFTNKNGAAVQVKDLSVVNQRTGETIKNASEATIHLVEGSYLVVDDLYRKKLSATGDDIKISATYEATGQTKTALVKVAGGKNSCHIEKLSGPDKIAFD